jgi:hypothetical protein
VVEEVSSLNPPRPGTTQTFRVRLVDGTVYDVEVTFA